jgi:formylglycine-generating enzyme required for sulfatase activity
MISSILFLTVLAQPALQQATFDEKIPEGHTSFKMVKLPDGEVTVNGKTAQVKNLYISDKEITWDVYDVYFQGSDLTEDQRASGFDAQSRPSRPYGKYDRGFGHANYPAVGMAFHAAEQFCNWLSKKTGKKYRLPTEAEWEYAARASATAEPTNLEDFAWFKPNAQGTTHEVGKKKPNAWGLYDMLGNAAEWCASLDEQQVTRGGSYQDTSAEVNFSKRVPYSLDWQERDAQLPKSKWWLSDGPFVGLRVVCEG